MGRVECGEGWKIQMGWVQQSEGWNTVRERVEHTEGEGGGAVAETSSLCQLSGTRRLCTITEHE